MDDRPRKRIRGNVSYTTAMRSPQVFDLLSFTVLLHSTASFRQYTMDRSTVLGKYTEIINLGLIPYTINYPELGIETIPEGWKTGDGHGKRFVDTNSIFTIVTPLASLQHRIICTGTTYTFPTCGFGNNMFISSIAPVNTSYQFCISVGVEEENNTFVVHCDKNVQPDEAIPSTAEVSIQVFDGDTNVVDSCDLFVTLVYLSDETIADGHQIGQSKIKDRLYIETDILRSANGNTQLLKDVYFDGDLLRMHYSPGGNMLDTEGVYTSSICDIHHGATAGLVKFAYLDYVRPTMAKNAIAMVSPIWRIRAGRLGCSIDSTVDIILGLYIKDRNGDGVPFRIRFTSAGNAVDPIEISGDCKFSSPLIYAIMEYVNVEIVLNRTYYEDLIVIGRYIMVKAGMLTEIIHGRKPVTIVAIDPDGSRTVMLLDSGTIKRD